MNLIPCVNLLVIEDEQSLLEAVLSAATRLGHRVQRVRDGEEAVVAMNAWGKTIQAVLLDWSLTCTLFGGALIEALYKIDPLVPIVVLTDRPEVEVRRGIKKGPHVVVLQKPFLPFELLTAIQNARPKHLG